MVLPSCCLLPLSVPIVVVIVLTVVLAVGLDALSEHTVQGHHWLVAGLESVSLDQPVHTTLEPEGWAVVGSNLTPHCLLKEGLW